RVFVAFRKVADEPEAFGIEDRQTVNACLTVCRSCEPEKDLDGGRLAGAVGTEESEQFADGDGKIDAVECGNRRPPECRSVLLAQAAHFDDVGSHALLLYGETCIEVAMVQNVARPRPVLIEVQ